MSGVDLSAVLHQALADHQRGALDAALRGYQQVLTAAPDQPDALHLLGQLLIGAGQPGGAGVLCRAVAAAPGEAGFMRTALNQLPFPSAAWKSEAARRAIALAPSDPMPWLVLAETDPSDETIPRALARAVGDPIALFNAANVAGANHRELAAVGGYALAIEASPGFHPAYANMAALFLRLDQPRRAGPYLQLALALDPTSVESLKNAASAARGHGQLEQAARLAALAGKLDGGSADSLDLLGGLRLDQGLRDEAMAAFNDAKERAEASAVQGSNRLFALQCLDGLSEADIDRESRRWAHRFAGKRVPLPVQRSGALHLGLFSGDFRTHSVAYFVRPLLAALDRQRVRVTLFAEQRGGDATTEALKGLAGAYVETIGLDDQAICTLVRERRVDVALDLAGHTGRNRLTAFALGLAPVQGTWLGYPGTTGLEAMDFRLTDAVCDPEGSADATHLETLVRLPVPFLCYGAPEVTPAVSAGPEGIVFGSFNNRKKLGPATVALWSAVLAAVPQSRLFAKSGAFDDARTRDLFREAFAGHGIDPARVEAVGWVDAPSGHLGLYDQVTVALDSVPYNGTTTTCEALWMGVPVVTLRGRRHAARVGASLLTALGRPEWIAEDSRQFVDIAKRLAQSRPMLEDRQALHSQLVGSPLMDQARFARAFTDALENLT